MYALLLQNRDEEGREAVDNALYAPPGLDPRSVSLMLTGSMPQPEG